MGNAPSSSDNSSNSSGTGDELFVKTPPPFGMMVFPVGLLWHWFTRRCNLLVASWPDSDSSAEPVASLVVGGLVYGETPRFRRSENALYFADMLNRQILKLSLATGKTEVVYEDAEDFISGLGWLPDGRMLFVSMERFQVREVDPQTGTSRVYADMAHVSKFRSNDMVVSTSGRAYVGNFGFNHSEFSNCSSTTLVSVSPDNQNVRVETTKLLFPNGAVITPDGKTLIVGETFAGRLTAFDIGKDGALSNRRVWATVGGPVDGICLDAEGCVWVSMPQVGMYSGTGGALVRVKEGGEILNLFGLQRNGIKGGVYACQLVTRADGEHHLYFLEAETSMDTVIFAAGHDKPTHKGELKSIRVTVGPALMPSNPNYSGGYC